MANDTKSQPCDRSPCLPLFQLTGLFQFTVRLASETEARFTSVERIHHYIQVLVTLVFRHLYSC